MILSFKSDDKRKKYDYLHIADFFLTYFLCYIFNWRLFDSRILMALAISHGIAIGCLADMITTLKGEYLKHNEHIQRKDFRIRSKIACEYRRRKLLYYMKGNEFHVYNFSRR